VPNHTKHTAYCALLEISPDAAKLANEIIDAPRSVPTYKAFRIRCGDRLYEKWETDCVGKPPKYNHDLARKYAEDAELDIRFVKRQTTEVRIAYFLHHLLDLFEEHSRPPHATVAKCRSHARQRMKEIFGSDRKEGNLLARYGLREDYMRAEKFFIGPKSQSWLQGNLCHKRSR
jgi:hypothetical protein